MDTDKEKVDYVFFGLVVGFDTELGYFSLNELKTAKEGMRGLRALPIERDVWLGIPVRRDNLVSAMYSTGLTSTTSLVTPQMTDRHGILDQKPPAFQLLS
jgi:hypothetical protein